MSATPLFGQQSAAARRAPRDTAPSARLDTVRVTATAAPRTVTFLPDHYGTTLLTGKRTETVLVDSVGANTAQNVARQVLGRIPGLTVAETEGSGFPSNGIALRGLNPTQSVEMNVRQNGVMIAADPYGYPETYYSPPMEAVERVEIIRGAGSLQFGPQLGGVVNYVMRRGVADKLAAIDVQHTVGSYGLQNTYGSVGGEAGAEGRWRWFAYAQRHTQDGWRPNSDNLQTSGYAAVQVALTPTLTAAADYSLLRNRIHMPGGLSDEQFEAGARQSFRARNWLTSPWNVSSLSFDWRPSRALRVHSLTSVLASSRSLVWRNEDGGPGALDVVDSATGEYVPREVEREGFRNVTEELRLLADYHLFGARSSLATGLRWFSGTMHRQGGGEGTTASDFDLSLVGPYEYDIRFANTNVAAWAENAVHLGSRLTLQPGVRIETLRSRAAGYTDTTFAPQVRSRAIPLFGLGASWIASATTGLYANATQAYQPIDYSALTPVGSVSRIDPSLHDTRGLNMDLGWRGSLADDRVRFDVGAFRLAVRGRIGLAARTDAAGATFTERTNVANSVHQGLESYLEVTPLAVRNADGEVRRSLTIFNSLALIDAHYTSGEFAGNRVEYAPRGVERAGVTIAAGPISSTFLTSVVGESFGDASNIARSDDAVVGRIPAYTVLDWSASLGVGPHWRLQGGVNNLGDRHYFTRRTDEYPGPGIIPAIGRSVYLSLRAMP